VSGRGQFLRLYRASHTGAWPRSMPRLRSPELFDNMMSINSTGHNRGAAGSQPGFPSYVYCDKMGGRRGKDTGAGRSTYHRTCEKSASESIVAARRGPALSGVNKPKMGSLARDASGRHMPFRLSQRLWGQLTHGIRPWSLWWRGIRLRWCR
jgi:hypothetical protein